MKVSVLIPYAPDESHLDATVDGVRASIGCGTGAVEWELITQKGADGASAARNAALARVTGDYVAWVDADDEVLPEWAPAIAGALMAAEGDMPDVIVFDAVAHWTDCQRPDYAIVYGRKPGDVPTRDFLRDTLADGSLGTRLWNRVFRRELFAGKRFEMSSFEDYRMYLDLVGRIRKVTYLARTLYRYRRSSRGLSQYGNAPECLANLLQLVACAKKVGDPVLGRAARRGVATVSADFLRHGGRRAIPENPDGVRTLRTFLRSQLAGILADRSFGCRIKVKSVLAAFCQ